jgi:nucleoside-diphosphate-sugar epimerase
MTTDPLYSEVRPLVSPDGLGEVDLPVAITGGTGFVGSHLVDILCAAGLRPRVLVRDPESPRWIAGRPVEWVRGSLDDEAALDSLVTGAGTVIHLAGVVRASREADFDRGNRVGTQAVVAAVRRAAPHARLIHVSSQAALGPSPDPAGLTTDAMPHPISAYGRSKLAAEEEVRSLGARWPWTIIRPPAIYGPRDTDVLEFFRMASRGLLAIPSGERWLTMAWVGDVVRAILAAASGRGRGRVLHVGQAEPRTMDDLLRRIAAAGDVAARLVRVPPPLVAAIGWGGSALHAVGWHRLPMTRDKAREILARHWTFITRPSLEALGLGDPMSIDDGARLTWAWYRAAGWLR